MSPDAKRRARIFASCLLGSIVIVLSLLAQSDKPREITVRGTLSRISAVGGESTGWAIRLDEAITIEGQAAKAIEADGPLQEFSRLENKHIQATGKIVIRRGVERGERLVLETTSIRELK